jgi:hypothetical protein
MRRIFLIMLVPAALFALLALGGGSASGPTKAQAGKLGIDDELTDEQERILSGYASYTLGSNAENNGQGDSQHPTTYFPRGSGACPNNISSNIKVNQNCLNLTDPDLQGRGQAQNETFIKADPNNPSNMIATYNDYRRGDGTCGVSWSVDSGRNWNDATLPNNFVRGGFINRPREYFQASGDPSVDWDSKGNAYYSCQMFKRGRATSGDVDSSNGLYVFRSTQNNGGSWNFPGRPVIESNNTSGNFLPLLDKQFMAVDHNATQCAGSPATATPGASCTPFQDRIYVTWTEFAPDGSAYIWESYSADYGEHFTARHIVSRSNTQLCVNTYGAGVTEGNCNENQFSQPFVGPDGVLYVIFSNYNNPETLGTTPDNRNQILISRSFDGGNTFEIPHKVADYYDLPDCATYQAGHDFGRACVPEKGPTTNSIFRAANYASGEVNPTNPSQVVVTFASYINRNSNESNGCVPTSVSPATGQNLFTGVKTPGACNNDIVVSASNDGGTSFTGTTVDPRVLPSATNDPAQRVSDQWFQWIAFTKSGKLATSYYDRQNGDDEVTGYSAVSLSGSGSYPFATWNVQKVSNGSMPIPTQFPESNGFSSFWGDYAGLTASGNNANPLWSDTRDPDLFACPGPPPANIAQPPAVCGATIPNGNGGTAPVNDENIYTANNAVPNG